MIVLAWIGGIAVTGSGVVVALALCQPWIVRVNHWRRDRATVRAYLAELSRRDRAKVDA